MCVVLCCVLDVEGCALEMSFCVLVSDVCVLCFVFCAFRLYFPPFVFSAFLCLMSVSFGCVSVSDVGCV